MGQILSKINGSATWEPSRRQKEKIIEDDGRTLEFFNGLDGGFGGGDADKLTDSHVIDILLSNDVKPDEVTFINLYHCKGITDETLKVVAERCPQLQILIVNQCSIITDVGIIAVTEKCPHLRTLDYSSCTNISDAALDAIATNCKQLEALGADGCGHSSIPEAICDLPLKTLLLSENNIFRLPRNITKLAATCTSFHIGNNPLQFPPLPIAEQGFEAMERYFVGGGAGDGGGELTELHYHS